MSGRVIEIADSGRYLSVYRGFLKVAAEGVELGRVPLADIDVLMLSGHGNALSTNVINALLDQGAVIVVCGSNYHPSAMIWPVASHHLHSARLKLQIGASRPLKKRLWQGIVRAKIENQSAVLGFFNADDNGLSALAERVGSGDPENLEAQAARKYWPLLMGKDFRRDTKGSGKNALLNYGYAVVRAATARSLAAAGLHPALGIHHHNEGNAFCLADDLMEPFRPLVDLVVKRLADEEMEEVTPEAKRKLAGILALELSSAVGAGSLSNCLLRLAQSLVKSFADGKAELDLPLSPLPLELEAVD